MPDVPPASVLLVYVTCADLGEARRIGRALVEERLAACVNIRPHDAIYRWQGKVEEASEFGIIVKTRRETYPSLEARLRALHSYTLPCIIAWAPEAGLPAYIDWIAEQAS